jgi:tRNA (cmo5U34)-methyltransferase
LVDPEEHHPPVASLTTEVGDGIRAPDGVWTFGGETPRTFDRHLVRSIPAYLDGHELIVDIADQAVPAGGRCYDLGCSTGALTARLAERLAPRGAEVIGVDREPNMIETAAERCAGIPSVHFQTAALEELEFAPADLAVCYYTLQFVPIRSRQQVVDRLHRALEPAGAIILFEKLLAPSARHQAIASGVYLDFKRRHGFTDEQIAAKTRSLRGVLQPLSAEENYARLRRAGFTSVMQVFRWMSFDGVIAFASSEPRGT